MVSRIYSIIDRDLGFAATKEIISSTATNLFFSLSGISRQNSSAIKSFNFFLEKESIRKSVVNEELVLKIGGHEFIELMTETTLLVTSALSK